VRVSDQRNVDDGGDVARVVGHLREPGEAEVGQAEPRGGRAVPGHVDNGEPRLLDEPGRDPVVGAGDDEALLLLDERAERAARRHAGSPLARAIRRSSAGCEYRTNSFHRLGRRSARFRAESRSIAPMNAAGLPVAARAKSSASRSIRREKPLPSGSAARPRRSRTSASQAIPAGSAGPARPNAPPPARRSPSASQNLAAARA